MGGHAAANINTLSKDKAALQVNNFSHFVAR